MHERPLLKEESPPKRKTHALQYVEGKPKRSVKFRFTSRNFMSLASVSLANGENLSSTCKKSQPPVKPLLLRSAGRPLTIAQEDSDV